MYEVTKKSEISIFWNWNQLGVFQIWTR